ncbi:MAG: PQQ-binding-like beta-propeller repeat protein [Thermoplasmatota archaeon]
MTMRGAVISFILILSLFIMPAQEIGSSQNSIEETIPQWAMEDGNSQRTRASPFSCSDNPGRVLWTYGSIESPLTRPAVDFDGTIYIGDFDSMLHAVNPDGTRKWVAELGSNVHGSPSIDPLGRIVAGTSGGQLECFDREGHRVWSFQCNGTVDTSPVFAEDGTVHVCTRVGFPIVNGTTVEWGEYRLYAVDGNGSEKWSYLEDIGILSAPTVGKDGTVYVNADGIVALYPNGTEKWKKSFSTTDPPIVRQNGDLLIKNGDRLNCVTIDGEIKWITEEYVGYHIVASDDGLIYGFSDDAIWVMSEYGDVNSHIEDVGGFFDLPHPIVDRDRNILWDGDSSLRMLDDDGNEIWEHIPDSSFQIDNYYGFYVGEPVITKDGTILYYCHPIDKLVALGPAPPAKVKDLRGTSRNSVVTLEWSYEVTPSDSPADYQNIDGFRIYRRPVFGDSPDFELVGEVGPRNWTFTDENAPIEKLSYKVVAFDGYFESLSSFKEIKNEKGSSLVRWISISLWVFGGIVLLVAVAIVILVSTVRSKKRQRDILFDDFFVEE